MIKAPSRPANSGRQYFPAYVVRRGLRGPFLGTFLGKQKGTEQIFTRITCAKGNFNISKS